jgi:quercetin dioxygenase-like cupin family protein
MQRMSASGEGWAVATLDDLGDGYGFRKVRKGLDVEAFGMNAIVMPPGIETGFHWHDEQDEVYFVHAGEIQMTFGDGQSQRLGAGAFAHVRAPVQRKIKNVGDGDAIYIIVGGKGGYVGRDGRAPEGTQRVQPSA